MNPGTIDTIHRILRWLVNGPPGMVGQWLLPVLTLLALLAAAPVHASQRIALVIGNGACQHDKVLPNPRNDANGMAAVLRRLTQAKDLAKGAMERTVLEFGARLAARTSRSSTSPATAWRSAVGTACYRWSPDCPMR